MLTTLASEPWPATLLTIVTCATLMLFCVRPPNHAVSSDGVSKEGFLLSWVVNQSPILVQSLFALLGATWTFQILSETFYREHLGTFCPRLDTLEGARVGSFGSLDGRQILGVFFILLGAWVRLSSYAALGRFFTYQVTIRKDHRLVTSGPYSFVRHPSYTGLLFVLAGLHLLFLSPDRLSPATCYLPANALRWINDPRFWVPFLGFGLFHLGVRVIGEESVLAKEFGAEWETYCRRVRSRFIPLVF